jgi:hypothetical protein
MHEVTRSVSPSESPKIILPKPAGSGLTLVIPSLKSLKASHRTKNLPTSVSQSSSVSQQDVELHEKKPPRPVKLKPLKEVLAKLIAQIKRFRFFPSSCLVSHCSFSHQKGRLCFFSKTRGHSKCSRLHGCYKISHGLWYNDSQSQ